MSLNKNNTKLLRLHHNNSHCDTHKLEDWGTFQESDACSSNHCKKEIEEKKFAKTVNLNKNEAIYLWNSLGEILTKSLLDVAKRQPENPIHSLAHSLIYYKYHKKSKDTPILAERLVPRRESVFKTIKTPQVEQQKTTSVDEDQEILPFTTNIAQQIMFNLFEQ